MQGDAGRCGEMRGDDTPQSHTYTYTYTYPRVVGQEVEHPRLCGKCGKGRGEACLCGLHACMHEYSMNMYYIYVGGCEDVGERADQGAVWVICMNACICTIYTLEDAKTSVSGRTLEAYTSSASDGCL